MRSTGSKIFSRKSSPARAAGSARASARTGSTQSTIAPKPTRTRKSACARAVPARLPRCAPAAAAMEARRRRAQRTLPTTAPMLSVPSPRSSHALPRLARRAPSPRARLRRRPASRRRPRRAAKSSATSTRRPAVRPRRAERARTARAKGPTAQASAHASGRR
ncbi:hypothetical protein DMC30DRAFT_39997 [Rhodotorula diobovata]|uniref:Uncharacterized protein n=1 Tax=Rhodotorula diobovata TaxID=5288 RepID=A0A5C5FQW4_9BASI|nr:hypothetical protein DMC30DRAFT_39997 [Rhodotorula diobovata]